MPTLYRKYRPRRWKDVSGQTHIVTTLTHAIAKNTLSHAYIFTGTRGTGKTTIARLFAQSVNCTNRGEGAEPCGACVNCRYFEDGRSLDTIEIDGASNNSVENIRELRETVKLPPSSGIKKIYIIDEVHMLSTGAWNALLKTLEEPPEHVIFILATTELHKVPETIRSRCQRFDFGRIPINLIFEKLERIAQSEGVTVDQDAIEMIALSAEGGLRDAESLLAQAIALEESHITGKEVANILGISERKTVCDFALALGRKDLDAALLLIDSLAQSGSDFRSFAGAFSHFVREILFFKLGKDAQETLSRDTIPGERDTLAHLADQFSFSDLARLLELIHEARKEIRFAATPEIPLEVAILHFLFPESEGPAGENVRSKNAPHSAAPAAENAPLPPPPISRRIAQNPKTPASTGENASRSSASTFRSSETIPRDSLSQNTEMGSEKKTPTQSNVSLSHSQSSETIPLSAVQDGWQAFLSEVKRANASLTLSLSNSSPAKSENGTLTIAVNRAFHKERLEKPENRLTVEEAIATIFSVPARLAVELVPHDSLSGASSSPPDPLLESALSILGGKVVG